MALGMSGSGLASISTAVKSCFIKAMSAII